VGCNTDDDDSDDDDSVDEVLYQQIQSGDGFSCVSNTNDEIVCWGRNDMGQVDAPAVKMTDYSCGDMHCCGITHSGEAECWGDNGYMQSTPPGNDDFISVAAGSGVHPHTCAIKENGNIVCWGSNSDGQTSVPDEMEIASHIDLGASRTCGVATDGSIQCWGFCEMDLCDTPQGEYEEVIAGYQTHGCAGNSSGEIACWGCSVGWDHGQCDVAVTSITDFTLGPMTTWIVNSEENVAFFGVAYTDYLEGDDYVPNEKFSEIDAGIDHVCGITTDNKIECWGENEYGQVSDIP